MSALSVITFNSHYTLFQRSGLNLRSRTKVKIVLKLALLKMAMKGQYICFRPKAVGNKKMNLFFDTGCNELVSKRGAKLNLAKTQQSFETT